MPILRDKKGKFIKGHSGYKSWLGKTIYPHMKKAVHKAQLGRKHSEEHKKKVVEGRKGYKHSEKTKSRIGFANKGKKRTIEMRDRISKAHIGINAGKNHCCWKGGITLLRDKIRHNWKYKKWRNQVFQRDSYICRRCKQIGGKLEAHHIKSVSLLIKENKIKTLEDALNCNLLWETDNGITYCIRCHSFIDKNRNRITRLIK